MATFYKQACPLCATEAEYCLVDYGRRKYFECPKCSYFQISLRAKKSWLRHRKGGVTSTQAKHRRDLKNIFLLFACQIMRIVNCHPTHCRQRLSQSQSSLLIAREP